MTMHKIMLLIFPLWLVVVVVSLPQRFGTTNAAFMRIQWKKGWVLGLCAFAINHNHLQLFSLSLAPLHFPPFTNRQQLTCCFAWTEPKNDTTTARKLCSVFVFSPPVGYCYCNFVFQKKFQRIIYLFTNKNVQPVGILKWSTWNRIEVATWKCDALIHNRFDVPHIKLCVYP